MSDSNTTRRAFLSSSAAGLGSGWLMLNLPLLTALSGCAREAAERGDPFTNLSVAEGHTLEAFVARVIPSDDGTPGATEAGAAYFVDGAIGGPFAGMAEPVRAGLAQLDAEARRAHGAAFHELDTALQDERMTAFQEAETFFPLRFLTVMGVMADPSRGGNRDHVGWAVLGMEHEGIYQPPFGFYDADYVPEQGGGA
ncbi:MAG: gluconate 2-dehydrogenase subunit 3 family protein [Gemmatimonadota bacterium]